MRGTHAEPQLPYPWSLVRSRSILNPLPYQIPLSGTAFVRLLGCRGADIAVSRIETG